MIIFKAHSVDFHMPSSQNSEDLKLLFHLYT